MMKTLWINKKIWEDFQSIFQLLRLNNDNLTLNKALNNVLDKGLLTIKQDFLKKS